jgi:hypothetical protein
METKISRCTLMLPQAISLGFFFLRVEILVGRLRLQEKRAITGAENAG